MLPKPELQTEGATIKPCVSPVDREDPYEVSSLTLGEGNSYGHGVIGKMMKWTARTLPTTQPDLGEEEKQRILEKLEPGDIVLTYNSRRPNLGHLEYLATGAHYTHCALYEGYGRIIETVGDKVIRSPLTERIDGPVKVAVVRPPYKSLRDRGQVIQEAKNLIGHPYDYRFDNHDHSEIYCSELIEVAMKRVDSDLDVPDVRFLGKELTAPDAFLKMNGAKLIHKGDSNYWTNQRHQWPLYLGAAAGAGLGASVGGAVGGALGASLGALAGALVGFEGAAAALG